MLSSMFPLVVYKSISCCTSIIGAMAYGQGEEGVLGFLHWHCCMPLWMRLKIERCIR